MCILYLNCEKKSRSIFGYVTYNFHLYFATKEKYFLTLKQICPIIYNMKDYQKRPWTHSERNMLRNNYYSMTEEELLQEFPDRTINSIRKQVAYLKKRGWCFIRKGTF